MKKLLLGLTLALASLAASADLILKTDQVQIILRDTAGCTAKAVAELIVPSELGRFKNAVVTFEGRQINACWTLDSGAVLIIDEEGDAAQIPAQAFKSYYGV